MSASESQRELPELPDLFGEENRGSTEVGDSFPEVEPGVVKGGSPRRYLLGVSGALCVGLIVAGYALPWITINRGSFGGHSFGPLWLPVVNAGCDEPGLLGPGLHRTVRVDAGPDALAEPDPRRALPVRHVAEDNLTPVLGASTDAARLTADDRRDRLHHVLQLAVELVDLEQPESRQPEDRDDRFIHRRGLPFA